MPQTEVALGPWRSWWLVRAKECAPFLCLCSPGHGPLADPVALRSEGADNPNIIQTYGHCFPDAAFGIQSAPCSAEQTRCGLLPLWRTLFLPLCYFLSFSSALACCLFVGLNVFLCFYISLFTSLSTENFFLQVDVHVSSGLSTLSINTVSYFIS